MSTKKREVLWGGRIMGADMRAQTARQEARKAARAADRAEAEAWSVRMEAMAGQRSRAQLSANARMAVMAGWRSKAAADLSAIDFPELIQMGVRTAGGESELPLQRRGGHVAISGMIRRMNARPAVLSAYARQIERLRRRCRPAGRASQKAHGRNVMRITARNSGNDHGQTHAAPVQSRGEIHDEIFVVRQRAAQSCSRCLLDARPVGASRWRLHVRGRSLGIIMLRREQP
jgi:hypothetical protein